MSCTPASPTSEEDVAVASLPYDEAMKSGRAYPNVELI
jgi:hypothetical protein